MDRNKIEELTAVFNSIINTHHVALVKIRDSYVAKGLKVDDPNLDITKFGLNDVIEFIIVFNLANVIDTLGSLIKHSPSEDYFRKSSNRLSLIRMDIHELNELEKTVWDSITLTKTKLVEVMNSCKQSLIDHYVEPVAEEFVSDVEPELKALYLLSITIISTVDIFKILMINMSMYGVESEFGVLLSSISKWSINIHHDIRKGL